MNWSKTQSAIGGLVLGGLVAGLSGCASYPISKDLRDQAKPVGLMQVTGTPDAYTGTVVIWGGRIIRTVNDERGGALYVLALPVRPEDEQPERRGFSTGRFIARSPDYLDPEVFRQGRLVTVAGRITGVARDVLPQIEQPYPVVALQEVQLWNPTQDFESYPGWSWGAPGSDQDWEWSWSGLGWAGGEPAWNRAWDYP